MLPNRVFPFIVLGLLPLVLWAETRWLDPADVRIDDGDTLEVRSAGNWQKIQLQGIDAPEDRVNPKFKVDLERTGLQEETLRSLGVMAGNHLRDLVRRSGGIELHYEAGDIDRYGRQLAMVLDATGASINRAMVADGFAIVTLVKEDAVTAQWRSEQDAAWKGKRGLWGLLREPAMRWANLPAAE